METIITFVRHGDNVPSQPTESWHPGPNLTKKGRNQAEKTGKYLESFEFDKIFSSDMNRTMQTTNIIAKHIKNPDRTSVSFHRKLSEHDEILYDGPKKGKRFRQEMAKAKRAVEFFKKILDDYPGKRILMVVHGNVIRACVGTFLDFPILKTPKLHLLHCSISTVVFKKNKVKDIYYLNSVSHYRTMKFIDKLAETRFKAKA